MQELFVPYELAVKLRDLGYDELCLARFDGGGFYMLPAHDPLRNSEIKEPWFCVTPIWDQVFSWFRNQHQTDMEILLDGGVDHPCYRGIIINRKYPPHTNSNGVSVYRSEDIGAYKTYEDCRLNLLIDLVEYI